MRILFTDVATLGSDLEFSAFNAIGECDIYQTTTPEELRERIAECDFVITNKVRFDKEALTHARNLKLICVCATGYDNIDLDECKKRGIGVANVVGYSTNSVAQVTLAMVLSLSTHLSEYDTFTKSGAYTKSGVPNKLEPVYHELAGKTWGIIGLGNIGKKVARVAEAIGCNVVAYKRTKTDEFECVDIDELFKRSDIITIHTPLNDGTRGLVNATRLSLCKRDAIIVNVARGAVCDDTAIADAVLNGQIGAFGTDVYAGEPMCEDNPLTKLCGLDNVILTPHMAWGAYEARTRCMDEVLENIKAFLNKEMRNRIV